jgi:hypothetical protein
MLHSKQLRSIKILIDSNHGIYRVGVRLGLAQQLRQERRLRRNMLDQTRHLARAPWNPLGRKRVIVAARRLCVNHALAQTGKHWGNDKLMICVKLALTAQLICFSDHTFVCTDNGSLAQLIGVSACTGPDRSQPNDDRRRVPGQRDLAVPVSTTGNSTSCGCVSPDSMGLHEDQP